MAREKPNPPEACLECLRTRVRFYHLSRVGFQGHTLVAHHCQYRIDRPQHTHIHTDQGFRYPVIAGFWPIKNKKDEKLKLPIVQEKKKILLWKIMLFSIFIDGYPFAWSCLSFYRFICII
jgi:hypothetical protein